MPALAGMNGAVTSAIEAQASPRIKCHASGSPRQETQGRPRRDHLLIEVRLRESLARGECSAEPLDLGDGPRRHRRYEPARYSAALAVAAITAGWALARWPTILPNLTVHQAAAGHDTLVCLIVAVVGGAIILFPALALLFHLTVAGRFRASELAAVESQAAHGAAPNVRLLARASIAA